MLISGWCCSRRRSGTLIGFYLLFVATNICEWFCQSDILRFCWNCTIKQTCSSSHSSSLQCFLHCLTRQWLRIFLQSGSLIIIIIGVTGRVLILSDILLHWEEALMKGRQGERERGNEVQHRHHHHLQLHPSAFQGFTLTGSHRILLPTPTTSGGFELQLQSPWTSQQYILGWRRLQNQQTTRSEPPKGEQKRIPRGADRE